MAYRRGEALMKTFKQINEAMSNKLRDKIVQMAGGKLPRGQEFRDLKKKAEAELKKDREVSKTARKAERETPKVLKKTGEDDHIMMQLRKAQDMDGNYSIQFHKGNGKLNKDEVNVLVKAFDKLKPEGKRKLRAMLKDVDAAKKVANSLKGKI